MSYLKTMIYDDFIKKYKSDIIDFAVQDIIENKESFFGGFTGYTQEDLYDLIEFYFLEFTEAYADTISIKLEGSYEEKMGII